MQQTEVKLNKKSVRNSYFRYLFPTIIGMVAHCCYCLSDVFFVGLGVGSNGLAALNVSLPVFTVYTTFSILIGVGAATTISICKGEGNTENINKVFSQAVLLVSFIGIIIAIFGTIFLKQLSYLFGATDLIVDGVMGYLSPINKLAFIYMLSSSLSVIVRSDNNPKLVMVAGTVGNIANIILDYIFVIKMNMGMFGAGLATIIGPCITLSILSLHFIKKYSTVFFTKNFVSSKLFLRMLRNGLGSGVLELSAGFIILMFNITLIKVSGETAVAIFSIISNIGYVGKGIFGGMAQAAQPIISISYGAKWYDRMKLVNKYAMLTALIFSLVVYLLILLFPANIIDFFISSDEQIISMGKTAIILYFLSFPFTGLNTIMMYYFQSIERVKYTTIIAIMRGIVLIYIALILFSKLWGLNGVWISIFVAESITFIIFYPLKLKLDKQFLTNKQD